MYWCFTAADEDVRNIFTPTICWVREYAKTHRSPFLFWWSAHSDGGKQMTLSAAIILCTFFCCCLCLQVFSFMHHPSGLTNSYLGFALPSYSSRSHLNWEHQFSRVNIYLLLSPHSIRFLLLLFNIWPYVYTDNPPFKTWPLASRAT